MTASCALWIFQAGCFGGDLATGSLPEWMTAIVTVLALAAAVYAGVAASSAARSAREQSTAATAALVASQKQADAAAESLSHSRTQAQAALDSVKHSEAAAESARGQAELARLAFSEDARVREEFQARLVYSEPPTHRPFEKGRVFWEDHPLKVDTSWDTAQFTEWADGEQFGVQKRFRKLATDVVLATVTVINKSPEIIAQVRLYFVNPHIRDRGVDCITVQPSMSDVIAPGGRDSHTISIPFISSRELHEDDAVADFMNSWERVIEFRDSSGLWWRRQGVEPIVKLRRVGNQPPDLTDWVSFESLL